MLGKASTDSPYQIQLQLATRLLSSTDRKCDVT